nr:MAG TPA: hypothetical protein [Caudoviricetes sp.]
MPIFAVLQFVHRHRKRASKRIVESICGSIIIRYIYP